MKFNKMIHNKIERIEFIIFNGMYKIPRRKKIIIYRGGRCIIQCYRPNEIKPCMKKKYDTNRQAVKVLFKKLQFLSHHANIKLMVHDTTFSKLKICYKLGNSELIGRLAFGIFILKLKIIKVITAETLINSFLNKYGDGTSLYDWTDCE